MSPSAKKPSLGAVFLTMFLDILGFSMVLPFLGEEARKNFGATTFVASLLATSYSLMQFVFVPVWGRLSDRIGRRPVMVWSVFATLLGTMALFGSLVYGNHIGWLFAARLASGVATANIGTASAYIADVTKPEDRAKGMALIGISFGFGFIIGPALGGILAETWMPTGRAGALPCLISVGLSAINFVWVLFGFVESLPKEKRSTTARSGRPLDWAATRATLSRPGIGIAVLVNFVIILSFTSLDQTFRFFNADKFALSARQTGIIFGFIGVCSLVVQGGLVRRLSGKVAEAKMIRAGLLFQAIAFGLLSLAPRFGVWALYAAGAVLALGNGLSQPSVSAYISKRADASEQGMILGTSQGFASLARAFGPALGGFLYSAVGPSFPYQTSAVGMLVALALALSLDKGGPQKAVATA